MALPLLGLGAAIVAAYAGGKISQNKQKSAGIVGAFPGEAKYPITPVDGAVLICGVYGFFEHSGIWCDGKIVELKGNGLVRAISPERFIGERSGETIYIAGDVSGNPFADTEAMQRAVAEVYQYYDYDVIKCNCHQFSWRCVSGSTEVLTRFSELNAKLSGYFSSPVYWYPMSSG